MFKSDYIMRQFSRLGELLAEILKLKKLFPDGDNDEVVRHRIRSGLSELGLDLDELLGMEYEDLIRMMLDSNASQEADQLLTLVEMEAWMETDSDRKAELYRLCNDILKYLYSQPFVMTSDRARDNRILVWKRY